MTDKIIEAAFWIVPLVFAIVFHEVAHGLMARALGDKTAQEMKRLSLNPLRHVDLIGTVALPGFLALAGLPVFGWAKPVPVNGRRLRNPRRDMMLVAAAGPGSNLIMAGLAASCLGLVLPSGMPQNIGTQGLLDAVQTLGPASAIAGILLVLFIRINVFLALFNLLPIPPFDGSHILEGLLPDSAARSYANLRKYGFLLVLVLIVVLPQLVPGFDPIGILIGHPVDWAIGQYYHLALTVAGT